MFRRAVKLLWVVRGGNMWSKACYWFVRYVVGGGGKVVVVGIQGR